MQRLNGRHALITGAGGGIGLAVTEAYLAEGALVSAVDLSAVAPSALAQLQARHPDRLAYLSADVSSAERAPQLVADAARRFGVVDVLFNNAAIFDMAPLLESDERMYQRIFDVNVKGMFFTMQAVLAALVQAGQTGAVVNLASQAGRRGEALVAHYCASKAAVISYTQSAALAMAPYGIRVNAISPGRCGAPSMPCSPATRACSPARRRPRWAKPCRWGAWVCRMTSLARRFFWRVQNRLTSRRRRSMWTAAM
jgi:D-sorbitol dehydrogenase (acceptor)